MKKLFAVISAIVLAFMLTFALVGCSDAGAPSHTVDKEPDYVLSAETLEAKLYEFMSDGRSDRTTFTEAEKDTMPTARMATAKR